MRSSTTLLALAVVLVVNLSACGGGGAGINVRQIPHVVPWRNNHTAQDLLDHWNQPELLQSGLGLSAVAAANLSARRSALAEVLRIAQSDPALTGTRLRNVRAEDVEIIGERGGITYGRWTDGPAGTLNIEFDWRFASGLDSAARARMERAGKAWSRRLRDDFGANTVQPGTIVSFDASIPDTESRSETIDEHIPVDDVLIAVLYSGANSEFSRGGPRAYNDTPGGYEPWFGGILLSRRHVNRTDVMVHEIGHVIGLAGWSQHGPESVIRYVNFQDQTFEGPESQRVNGGEPVPFQWLNSEYDDVPPGTSGATPDYGHFGVCDSIMAYCRNRREVLGPTELDFAYLADIGYEVLDARTASEPEIYGYGAWGRYSAWGVGVERILDAPGGDRDTLRAGADAFGILPSADFADVHRDVEGDATWTGALLGVDLGRAMLPPVFGDAELRVDLSSLVGTARFEGLTVLVDGATHGFRTPNIEYGISVAGNGFAHDAGLVSGGFFGPAHEEMAGVVDDRDPQVNLLAGFGGTR